jgi:hypothetical protein
MTTARLRDIPRRSLQDTGYAFVHATEMRCALEADGALSDWDLFAASWGDLELDTYLADRGRYRRRRHAVYTVMSDGTAERQPHQPHHQGEQYNRLFGGVDRWFAPVRDGVGDGPTMRTILRFCGALFGDLAPDSRVWRAEVHQFRIEARPGEEGQPTPEGLHRDGVDFVLVLLVQRRNIDSGTTTIHGLDREPLGAFTLTQPFDAALVDDSRVYHGVTPVTPLDRAQPAFRDVLVVTFRKVDDASASSHSG